MLPTCFVGAAVIRHGSADRPRASRGRSAVRRGRVRPTAPGGGPIHARQDLPGTRPGRPEPRRTGCITCARSATVILEGRPEPSADRLAVHREEPQGISEGVRRHLRLHRPRPRRLLQVRRQADPLARSVRRIHPADGVDHLPAGGHRHHGQGDRRQVLPLLHGSRHVPLRGRLRGIFTPDDAMFASLTDDLDRLRRLAAGLSSLSRVEEGAFAPHREPADIAALSGPSGSACALVRQPVRRPHGHHPRPPRRHHRFLAGHGQGATFTLWMPKMSPCGDGQLPPAPRRAHPSPVGHSPRRLGLGAVSDRVDGDGHLVAKGANSSTAKEGCL